MNDTHADIVAVDVLEDVDLAARRPQRALAVRLAHEPEGRPDALLLRARGAADAQLRLDARDLAGRRGDGVLALDATACPASNSAAVLAREYLQTACSSVLY